MATPQTIQRVRTTPVQVGSTPLRRRPPQLRRLRLRRASREHMTIAADIIRSTSQWYQPFLADEDMAEHDVDAGWEERNFGRRDFFIGYAKDEPVGVLATQPAGRSLYLGYVYVYEHQVSRGYGRELLEFARDRATAFRNDSMVLIAHPEAQWATRAYQRFGFEQVASERSDVLAWNDGWLAPYYEQGFALYEYDLRA